MEPAGSLLDLYFNHTIKLNAFLEALTGLHRNKEVWADSDEGLGILIAVNLAECQKEAMDYELNWVYSV
jgi:hypothetical protein